MSDQKLEYEDSPLRRSITNTVENDHLARMVADMQQIEWQLAKRAGKVDKVIPAEPQES